MYGWNELIFFFNCPNHPYTWLSPNPKGVELSSSNECVLQIRISEKLKREIMRAAFENEQTLRCYLLEALKAQGIQVSDDDLIDRRKSRTKDRE